MILFGRNFNHPCILIDFEEFFQTSNFRNLTAYINRKTHWSCVFELNFENSCNFIIFFYRRNFDSNFHLRSFFGSYFESDLFEVLISLVTSHWKNILIKVIELFIVTLGNNSKEEWLSLLSFWNYVVCQINWNIHFLDWAWIKSGFSELNDLTIDIYKMAGFRLNFFKFFFWRLFLFRLNLLFFFGLFSFLWLSLLWGGLLKSEIFHLFLNFCNWSLSGLVGTHKSSQIFSIDYFWFIYLFPIYIDNLITTFLKAKKLNKIRLSRKKCKKKLINLLMFFLLNSNFETFW